MSDQEAVENPESFVSYEEEAAAQREDVGDGSPGTAPEELPPVTFGDRVRRVLGVY